MLSYAENQQGEAVVDHILCGGKPFVSDSEFQSIAVRAEEFVEERSDEVSEGCF